MFTHFEFNSGISSMKSIPDDNDPIMIQHENDAKIIESAVKGYNRDTKLNTLIGKRMNFNQFKPEYNDNKSNDIGFNNDNNNSGDSVPSNNDNNNESYWIV